jgi:hypothetical protein
LRSPRRGLSPRYAQSGGSRRSGVVRGDPVSLVFV